MYARVFLYLKCRFLCHFPERQQNKMRRNATVTQHIRQTAANLSQKSANGEADSNGFCMVIFIHKYHNLCVLVHTLNSIPRMNYIVLFLVADTSHGVRM